MAKITDPDFITQGVEATFILNLRHVRLSKVGNLSDDGVRQQALFSFAKEEFLVDALLKPHPFPWIPIFDEQFEMVEDWTYEDQNSENLVRDAGLAYRDGTGAAYGAGTIQSEFIGFDNVFALDNNAQVGGDQIYVELDEPNGETRQMYITGQANQLIKVFQNNVFDYRNNDLRFHVREPGKKYGFVSFSSLNVPLPMTFKRYPFPLQNSPDTDIVATDAEVAGSLPYTGMSITSYATPQARTIGAIPVQVDTVINGNGASLQQIYTYVQHQRRLVSDIDADAAAIADGDTSDVLLEFVGANLFLLESEMWGRVWIDDFDATQNKFLRINNTGVEYQFPFSAGIKLQFTQTHIDSVVKDFNLYYRYIKKVVGTDIAITAATNSDCTLTTTGGDFTTLGLVADDFVSISGFNGSQANGIVKVVGAVTANSMSVTSELGRTFANEIAGAEVTLGSKPFGSSQAVLVTDSSASPVQGDITALELNYSYDYSNNTDGGRDPDTVAEVVLEAVGDTQAQYNYVFGTINKVDVNPVSISGALERVFLNAA